MSRALKLQAIPPPSHLTYTSRAPGPLHLKLLVTRVCLVNLLSPLYEVCTLQVDLQTREDRMRMRPESMQRWGRLGILKEAGSLLHKHFRLFMPFFLAFHLPASFLSVFQNVFLVASGPSLRTSFVRAAQGAEMDTDNQPSVALTWTLLLLIFIFSCLAMASFAYVVEYVYSNASDDDSITKSVFKLLPHALLRIFVTQLWSWLVLFLLAFACGIFAAILTGILSALIGGDPSGPSPAFFIFFLLPAAIGTITLAILFALAPVVAVLEQEKYGRLALKQSSKYAKGRAGTIFGIALISAVIGGIIYGPAQAVANAGLSLWVEIIVASFLSILNAIVSAYLGLVGVVLYFVCKSNFEAVLPEFQRSSNIPPAENEYKPLVHGSDQPKTVST
ncbi:hypothetical protein M758_2G137500 [Ceratodon purpureus]|nr:hypothetical protein M758_2G137500 [Ceratodon purpureus]